MIKKVELEKPFVLKINQKVEKIIRHICKEIWDTEWSGVLFYNIKGTFSDDNITVECVDILPMDIGEKTYTEFAVSPDIISYMTENPKLLDCKTGLIHSHNSISTFFSGTDLSTLEEEGKLRNYFVSLIVNNKGDYTAAITQKLDAKISYSYLDTDSVVKEDFEDDTDTVVYYYPLEVNVEFPKDIFDKINVRLESIREKKRKVMVNSTPYYPRWDDDDYYSTTDFRAPWEKKETITTTIPSKTVFTDEKEEKKDTKVSALEDVAENIALQLISGCVTATIKNINKETREKLGKSVESRFSKRFATIEEFNLWATGFIDYLIWGEVGDITETAPEELAEAIMDAVNKYPKNKYIDELIVILTEYGQ